MAEVTREQAPKKVRDLFDKGFAALEHNNLDYAMDLFAACLDMEPHLLQARQFLRAASIKKFKDKDTGKMAHTLSGLKGLSLSLSISSSLKKTPVKALKDAEKLLRLDLLNKSFIKLFVEVACVSEMPEAAVQTMEIALEHYPENTDLLERLGALYLNINETQKAKSCFEKLLQLNPKDPKLIKAYKDASALDTMNTGGWSEAKSYRDVIKDVKHAETLEQETKAVKTAKDVNALIEDAKQKIEQEPENFNYKRSLADLYTKAERFEEALKILHEAQTGTEGGDPNLDRSISAIYIKRFDKEIEALQVAGNEEALNAKQEEKDRFLFKDIADRVRKYPNDLSLKYDYGEILYQRGSYNEAIQEFQQSQRNPHRRTNSLYYLGLSFKEKKQYDIAAEQFEKAASEINTMDASKKDIFQGY